VASFATLSPDLDRAAAGALGAQEASALRRELVQAVGGAGPEPRPHDERVQAALAFIDRHRLEDTSLERVAAGTSRTGSRARRGASVAHDTRARLGDIQQPTFVVCGSIDSCTPVGHSEELARLIPHAELVVLPDGGHFIHTEQDESFFETVRAFVDRN